MVTVFDIGNTNVHIGLYDNGTMIDKVIYPISTKYIEHRCAKIIERRKLEGIAIASVVPNLTRRFKRYFRKKFNISSLIISSRIDCHLVFNYYRPQTLGPDRIANVVGGLECYKRDLIVIDFGTATTFDMALKDGSYLGGLIIPGIGTSSAVLSAKTALLPTVKFKKPENIIGRSTAECIQSGIFNGTAAMIKGLIKGIRKEQHKNFLCVATGGWGNVIVPEIDEIKHFDPDLCLYGIYKIYCYNA